MGELSIIDFWIEHNMMAPNWLCAGSWCRTSLKSNMGLLILIFAKTLALRIILQKIFDGDMLVAFLSTFVL